MVLIEISGSRCSHVNEDIQETLRIFGLNVREKLLNTLLSVNHCDVDIQFHAGSSVDLAGKEKFLVKVNGQVPATQYAARTIAECCNAAFYCSRETQPISTKCIIQSSGGFVSDSSEKLLSI